MALFDQDSNNNHLPPPSEPGVSDPFETLLKQPTGGERTPPGEFTMLFGTPPKPVPLAGIGADNPPAPVVAEAQAPANLPVEAAASNVSAPSSFTMLFGTSPSAASAEQPYSEPLREPAVAPMERPTSAPDLVTRQSEPGTADSFTALFSEPVGRASAESSEARLEQASTAAEAAPPVVPATAAPPVASSEFTSLFGNPNRPLAVKAVPEPFTEPTLAATPATTAAASLATPPAPQEPPNAPGTFTQLFGAPAKPIVQAPPQPPATAGPKCASPEEFAGMFNFPLRDSSAAPEPAPKPAPGEFTAMFNSTPPISPAPAPKAQAPGAFTQLFNAPLRVEVEAPKAQQPDGFNKLFATAPVEPRADTFTSTFGSGAAPVENSARPESSPVRSQVYPAPGMESASNSATRQPMAGWPLAAPSQTPASASSSGATQIFTRPEAPPPMSTEPPPPVGPSAFTQIISGGLVRELAQRAAAQAGQPPLPPPSIPQAAASMPNFAQPPQMNVPGMWPPATPMQPQMPFAPSPYMQMPQPPMPQPPALPAAPPKTNWLPVIVGVNVFVVIVVILILIFVLRK